MVQHAQDQLKNLARGQSYQEARAKIFKLAAELGASKYDIPNFLRDKLFKIEKGSWRLLQLDRRDWSALEDIRDNHRVELDSFYLQAAVDYVLANAARVNEIYNLQEKITAALFFDEPERAYESLQKLPDEDRQSLFALRTAGSQLSFSGERLEEYLRQTLRGEWLKKRFLYPLIFYALNQPADSNLDDFISFIVTGEESAAERVTIRFLLRDEIITTESIAFKMYLALMCHPYDACEILLNHIELELCKRETLPTFLRAALIAINSKIDAPRPKVLLWLLEKDKVKYLEHVSAKHVEERAGLDEKAAAFLCYFIETKSNDWKVPGDEEVPKTFAPLARMRARPYPIPDDFESLTSTARFWWFITGGRVLNSFITSLYMMPRTEQLFEVRDALRLVMLFGGVTPFALSSPSGALLLRDHFPNLRINGLAAEVATDRTILQSEKYADRMWIKSLHWHLRVQEARPLLATWLQVIRQKVRAKPAFLSGVNWEWLDGLIQKLRLKPFRGNPAGIYVLLLQKMEELDRHTDAMRISMEPFVEGKTLAELMDWLILEYRDEAIAFARYLLTPEDILLLGLAPNHTAAIAGRIEALEMCIRQFNYTELLPQHIFAREWETLNSTLLLLSVNAGQFEIPWATFEKDAAVKQHDLYTAAYNLRPGADKPAILTDSKVRFPYAYRRGTRGLVSNAERKR